MCYTITVQYVSEIKVKFIRNSNIVYKIIDPQNTIT